MTQAGIDEVGIGNAVEGETAASILLARRFSINSVLDKPGSGHPGLVFWYWMWARPDRSSQRRCLRLTKIVRDRTRPLMAFGHFIEG
jgi:hypothetical protein